MSLVSLCVIVIEVTEEENSSFAPLSYTTPRYEKMSSDDPKGKLVFGTENTDRSKCRGKRIPRTMTLETYNQVDDATDGSGTSGNTVKTSQPGETSKINFFSGNPYVEVLKGVIHLHKENEGIPIPEKNEVLSEMLCMLSVPANVNCRELLQFIAPSQSGIQNLKIIRDGTPNEYMALIKMKSAKMANAFYKEYNGKTFNSIEDDVCHLVYVSRIESMRDEDGAGLPIKGHTELPTCPVCLERMEESVDGILTILCNHTFHSACLSKWSDSSCPVCRYVQTPEMVASNQCSVCQSSDSLWICLICGHVGCGRYVGAHAYRHFCETSHCYAIQPDNNRVWDYVGDSFVHRLLQNKPDGKLVAMTGAENPEVVAEGEEKLDSMQLEFAYLLSTQLETQRKYWQETMDSMKRELQSEIESVAFGMDALTRDKVVLETKVCILEKERAGLERKIAQLTSKLTKVTTDLKEEKELNKSLGKSQKEWAACNSSLEKQRDDNVCQYQTEIADLKEQLRDLMFYIEAQNKIEESPLKDEIQDGTVIVNENSQKPTSSSSGKKKKR